MRLAICVVVLSLMSCGLGRWAEGQVFDERFEDWPIDLKIHGRLVVAAEPQDLSWLPDLFSATELREECLLIDGEHLPASICQSYQSQFKRIVPCAVEQLPEHSTETAASFLAWHLEPEVTSLAQSERIAAIADHLRLQLSQGRTVIVTGAAAQMAAKSGWSAAAATTAMDGLQLLPDCVLELAYDPSQSKRMQQRVRQHQRCVGVGLEPKTLLSLDGRQLQVAGVGRAWLVLPAGAGLPSRLETIAPRAGRYDSITHWLADLTEWRRDAIDRTLEPFPPAKPQPPVVAAGTLVIVGGGGMPRGLMQRFVELAGGQAAARLVYIPCTEEEEVPPHASITAAWHALGVEHACILHTKDRQRAHTDENFLAPLKDATGIWFGGGRQWNLADSYYGTQAHRLMKSVLQRGGVIGGSSAGASIQARYLARATPIENVRLMAPGYERGGLGFISGVAIDQHFSQRNRLPDMAQLVQRYPQLLGIGIDEATALIVQGSQAEITGEGAVYFYDAGLRQQAAARDYLKATAGECYNLVERRLVAPAE